MSELQVSACTESSSHEWDQFVISSRNGTFMHLRQFMTYHADRFEDLSVIIWKGREVNAVFPANRVGSTLISHGGITFGGLIYGMNQRAVDVRETMHEITKFYWENGISKIYYKPTPHIFHKYPAEDDLHALFLLKAKLVKRELSSAIQLKNRPKLAKSRMAGVKKALDAGLKIVDGQFFSEFHALLCSALARHDAQPVHSVSEISMLQSRFPENISLVGAFHEGSLLAAAWLFKFHNVVHTQYLACSDVGRTLGALDYLIAEIIERSCENFSFMSFGSSTERDGYSINDGLLFQKEGFGARSVVLDHYELNLSRMESET